MPARVDHGRLAGCEEPVRRFLSHALADGAPAGSPAALRMEGRIRLGRRWVPFTADERLDGRSFTWRARVGLGPLTLLRVTDRYADGAGAMRLRLLGLIPLPGAAGPDTARSAAGRCALEAVAWAPGCVLPGDGVRWRAEGEDEVVATIDLGIERVPVHVRIDERGAPRAIWAPRWGGPDGTAGEYVPCGCEVLEEAAFGDVTAPSRVRVGWWFGTPRHEPFFEARVTAMGHAAAPAARARRPGGAREVLEGLGGAGIMLAALATPHLRARRSRWGLDAATAARRLPGDDLVRAPRWSWTHGVEVAAPAEAVWPWVAQVGADRAGFYSYEWLENLAGCRLRNAGEVHPEWEVRAGDGLLLHPRRPALPVAALEPGRWFVVHAAADPSARAAGEPWVEVSWLLLVEPLGEARSRVISRYRCATSYHLRTRLGFGPALVEPIGFAMDRRMLLGIRERAERAERAERGVRPSSA